MSDVQPMSDADVREMRLSHLPREVREALEQYALARANLERAEDDERSLRTRLSQAEENLRKFRAEDERAWAALLKIRRES